MPAFAGPDRDQDGPRPQHQQAQPANREQPRAERMAPQQQPQPQQRAEMPRQEPRQYDTRMYDSRMYDMRAEEQRHQAQQQDQGARRGGRLTPDERRELRRQINEAGTDLYPNAPRR
jgi:hypothetical protein